VIYIAIPTITPRLENCARWAIARTTPEPHRVIVARGRSHGENLDAAFAGLPEDAEWFMTIDDDAAPLRVGWLSWLVTKAEGKPWASFWRHVAGYPHPMGTLYSVPWLRIQRASFLPGAHYDTGGQMFPPLTLWSKLGFYAPPCDRSILPWWLSTCDVAADDRGFAIFAHLGGGTIGHTWYHRGRLYPRIPTWLWPILVRRYLVRFARPEQTYCSRCGTAMYFYGAGWPVCVQCETPEEERTWRERMERARQIQAWEESR